MKIAHSRTSDRGLGASGVGFGLLRQLESPGDKSLRAPGRRAKNIIYGKTGY
jgi:hypothetical protein